MRDAIVKKMQFFRALFIHSFKDVWVTFFNNQIESFQSFNDISDFPYQTSKDLPALTSTSCSVHTSSYGITRL